jgi:hypothetical protein
MPNASRRRRNSSPTSTTTRPRPLTADSVNNQAFKPVYENATNEKGERLIWLDRAVVDRLRAIRGPGESYSDVILRLAG